MYMNTTLRLNNDNVSYDLTKFEHFAFSRDETNPKKFSLTISRMIDGSSSYYEIQSQHIKDCYVSEGYHYPHAVNLFMSNWIEYGN